MALSPLQTSTSPRLWLDARTGVYKDAGSTLATAGTDTVQQWNDRSSNANNWSQATSGNRPAYVTQNGVLGVYLATTGDKFMSAGTALSAGRHFFFLDYYVTANTNGPLVGHNSNIDWLGDSDGTKFFDSTATANLYGNVIGQNRFWVNGYMGDIKYSNTKTLGIWLIVEVQAGATSTINQFKDRTFSGREPDCYRSQFVVYDSILGSTDRAGLLDYLAAIPSPGIVLSGKTASASGGGIILPSNFDGGLA